MDAQQVDAQQVQVQVQAQVQAQVQDEGEITVPFKDGTRVLSLNEKRVLRDLLAKADRAGVEIPDIREGLKVLTDKGEWRPWYHSLEWEDSFHSWAIALDDQLNNELMSKFSDQFFLSSYELKKIGFFLKEISNLPEKKTRHGTIYMQSGDFRRDLWYESSFPLGEVSWMTLDELLSKWIWELSEVLEYWEFRCRGRHWHPKKWHKDDDEDDDEDGDE